ncbi:MAG TPA: tetratricopeptide repeat protein [Thermoanaerobaculia bacterium]|nr:tetratricopeptide repeat protein [Thermoanaerobaculia bacterium]
MHYDDEALFEYVEGTSPIASEIELHVSACARCSSEVGGHREMISALASEDVWQQQPAPAALPREFVVNVSAFAERARREEREAEALCDEILTGPAAWWPQRLRKTDKAYTAGMVTQLLERVGPIMDNDSPANALQVTAMAIEIANALHVVQYPCDYVVKLRANASRDHAYVLSFLGRHPEALAYIERAKELYDQVPLPEYDLARLALVKALVLRSIDRPQEAVQLAREAAETFLRFGDRTRYLNARVTEAAMVFRTEAVEDALALSLSLEQEPDLEIGTRVRVMHNIGTCYVRLNQPLKAIDYLQHAVAEYEVLGMPAEQVRSRWQLGQALVAAGKVREAVPMLRQAWREFDGFEMTEDAALVALNLTEALLILGEPAEVPAICREIVARFTHAGMTSRAMTALSFLREAIALGEATPSLIRHVYAFLRKLPDERPRLHPPAPSDSLDR